MFCIIHQEIFGVLLRSSHQSCSVRIGVLRNFTKFAEKHLCKSSLLIKLQACNFIKKENSCEFCEISKNTFFREHLRTSASVFCTFFVMIDFLETKYMFRRNWYFFLETICFFVEKIENLWKSRKNKIFCF